MLHCKHKGGSINCVRPESGHKKGNAFKSGLCFPSKLYLGLQICWFEETGLTGLSWFSQPPEYNRKLTFKCSAELLSHAKLMPPLSEENSSWLKQPGPNLVYRSVPWIVTCAVSIELWSVWRSIRTPGGTWRQSSSPSSVIVGTSRKYHSQCARRRQPPSSLLFSCQMNLSVLSD